MQYCSLQHWTLLLSPITSTTEHCFYFGQTASFFLELLVIALCSSPVPYWTPPDQGAHLLMSYLFAFSYCTWGSQGKNTGVGYHFILQGIFPTQGSNPGLLHFRQMPYLLSHQGSPGLYRSQYKLAVYSRYSKKPSEHFKYVCGGWWHDLIYVV